MASREHMIGGWALRTLHSHTIGCLGLEPPSPFPATLGSVYVSRPPCPGPGSGGCFVGETCLLCSLHSERRFLGCGCGGGGLPVCLAPSGAGLPSMALTDMKSKGDAAGLGDAQRQP